MVVLDVVATIAGWSASKVLSGCPQLGHDTEIVLKELLGYSNNKIDRLRKQRVIF